MRTRPTATLALGIFAGYAAYLILSLFVVGVDFDEIAASAGNLAKGMVLTIGIGSILLALLTTRLGWWKEVLSERPAGPRWLLALPIAMLVAVVANLLSADLGAFDTDFILLLLVGTALVGFSEELLARGLALVGFRGTVSEAQVWLFTSAIFGLLHGINFIGGQAAGDTLVQMAFAFAFGSALYVTRRVTGTLIACMIVHALWDFSVFLREESTTGVANTDLGTSALALIATYAVLILTVIGLFKLLRGSGPEPKPAGATG